MKSTRADGVSGSWETRALGRSVTFSVAISPIFWPRAIVPASFLPEVDVESEIERRSAVRESSYRDEIDAGFGDRAHRFSANATACFGEYASADQAHRLGE